MLTAGSYLTPILLGGKNSMWFTQQIYAQFITRYNWEYGSTFGVMLLVFTSLAVWLGLRLSGQKLVDDRGAGLSAMNVAAPQEPLLLWAYRGLRGALLPLSRRAARRGERLRLQRFAVPEPALARASRSTGSSTAPSRSSACSTTAASCRAWRTRSISARSSRPCRCSRHLNAFLFERRQFPGKTSLYILMIIPLVIPGVILGISILVFASTIANGVEDATGIGMSPLRPGIFLVVLGQFSFLATITTLVIAARLKKFDIALEEAALNLGASRAPRAR